MKEDPHVIVVDSLSKRFSLCGARLGCLITTNREVWAMCLNLAQARLASPTMEQLAAAHMLDTIPDSVLNQTIKEYEGRRNLLCSELQKIPGVSVCPPDGAFYLLAKLPVKSSEEFARNLLSAFAYQGKTVFVAPGPGFFINGKKGEQLVRLAFVLKEAKLRESVDILRDAITQAPF